MFKELHLICAHTPTLDIQSVGSYPILFPYFYNYLKYLRYSLSHLYLTMKDEQQWLFCIF